jgi:hypothetical protein
VQANVVFQHFGHETVDAVAHVRQEHKNVRAVRLSCTPSRLSIIDMLTFGLSCGNL